MSTSTALAAAFDLLQGEVEAKVARINQEDSAAFAAEHDRAAAALARAKELKALQQRLSELGDAFPAILRPAGPATGGPKLSRGPKTPEEAYRLPILKALVDLGGSGTIDAVLERVQAMMADRLNQYDLAPLLSDESLPRWRNTAQWARNALRAEGLLKPDSPRGLWELIPAGRQAAAQPIP